MTNVQEQNYPYELSDPRSHHLVVPCVIASRDGADMGATFNDANLDRSKCNRSSEGLLQSTLSMETNTLMAV